MHWERPVRFNPKISFMFGILGCYEHLVGVARIHSDVH